MVMKYIICFIPLIVRYGEHELHFLAFSDSDGDGLTPAWTRYSRSCLMSCLMHTLLWRGWCSMPSTLFRTTRKRAPWLGSTVAPKWCNKDSISRQWMLPLTGSWNIVRSKFKWWLMAGAPLYIDLRIAYPFLLYCGAKISNKKAGLSGVTITWVALGSPAFQKCWILHSLSLSHDRSRFLLINIFKQWNASWTQNENYFNRVKEWGIRVETL